MQRLLVIFALLALAAFLMKKPDKPAYDATVCAGPPLRSTGERNQAMEDGYAIHPRYGCIDKASFDAVQADRKEWNAAQEARANEEREAMAEAGATTFAQQRHGFTTTIAVQDSSAPPLPSPPATLFVRSDYKNASNYMLPGYVTPDPQDGQRHPAIIWITGGDSNSLGDFWTPGPDSNDQSARAFREAGMIMAFPTLRGGNGGRSKKEFFYGEVDDILSAAAQLARLRYVDPERIYLGGHSTGGTLALLTAATRTPFRAIFAFGPVASVDRYTPSLIPVDFSQHDPLELKLRSPVHWLDDIENPTYIIEGVSGSGNRADLETLCAATRNPAVHCIPVHGSDHFSVIRPVTRLIAERLTTAPTAEFSLQAEEFSQ
ncbi:MAG: prolyl oligopeptidase family serine peptidase [Moraxellaceae bacterium]|nr:prolyl oligopeptidase family serine peptidase [Moraxellaceae bacterium]